MTQEEVYKQLWLEMYMRFSIKALSPHAPNNFLEIAEYRATNYTIKHTWYWFNNQAEFLSFCFYYTKSKDI